MRKLLGFAIATLIIVVGVWAYFFINSEERTVKNYVKDEYGFEIVINDVKTYGIGSNSHFIVAPKNHRDLVFKVIVNSSTGEVMQETYELAAKADEVEHTLEEKNSEFKKVGFSLDNVNILNEGVYKGKMLYNADFYSTNSIQIETIEEEHLERFFKLQEIVQSSEAKIDQVVVDDGIEHSFVLNMNNLKGEITKEELLLELKKSNWDIATYYANKKYETEKEKVENERFNFGSEYDERWFNCLGTNEKGQCTNILVSIHYEEGGLTQSNPKLVEDLNSIFTLFEETITPRPTVTYRFLGSSQSIRISDSEISSFGSTSEFIKENF